MARPQRTQKQIAERYKGNLAYYKVMHPWRKARMIVTALAILGGIAAAVYFSRSAPGDFYSIGPLSPGHTALENNCAACHGAGAALPATVENLGVALRQQTAFARLDAACASCHEGRDFHAPNVVSDTSCSACHQEHRGTALVVARDSDCLACHNNPGLMQAAAAKGAQMPASAFKLRHVRPHETIPALARPAAGFTSTFASFAGAHPEFRVKQEAFKDPNTLRFNHQRHFEADIPPLHGKKMDCQACHTPEPGGRQFERITFERNCQACHALQFDPAAPELTLPHGDPGLVRGFLRSLPSQYADLARKRGMTEPGQISAFATRAIKNLQARVRSGEALERQVFFATDPYKAEEGAAPGVRAMFHGCAYCHEVRPSAGLAPSVAKPQQIDRWMPHALFDHASHASVRCDDCHHTAGSRATSDVLLPVKADCVSCHSPQGKVASNCITCHSFHAAPVAVAAGAQSAGNLREMMLGKR